MSTGLNLLFVVGSTFLFISDYISGEIIGSFLKHFHKPHDETSKFKSETECSWIVPSLVKIS